LGVAAGVVGGLTSEKRYRRGYRIDAVRILLSMAGGGRKKNTSVIEVVKAEVGFSVLVQAAKLSVLFSCTFFWRASLCNLAFASKKVISRCWAEFPTQSPRRQALII
jgi:hypothetical protein